MSMKEHIDNLRACADAMQALGDPDAIHADGLHARLVKRYGTGGPISAATAHTVELPPEARRLRISAGADGKVTSAMLDAAFDADPLYAMPPAYLSHLAPMVRQRRTAVRLKLISAGALAA